MTKVRALAAWLWLWAYNLVCPQLALAETVEASLPSVSVHYTEWTTADDQREQQLYLVNPLAFWLRPDRHDHHMPCWMVEGAWSETTPGIEAVWREAPSVRKYDIATDTMIQTRDLSQCAHGLHYFDEDATDPRGWNTCLRCGTVKVTPGR